MTAIEIIDETVEYYSANINRRSVDFRGVCVYRSTEGNHCAVGRCMTKSSLHKYGESTMTPYDFKALDALLYKRYQGQPIELWDDLQSIHDYEGNWDENGLSAEGIIIVDNIKKRYGI